jgi:hypothetical protein
MERDLGVSIRRIRVQGEPQWQRITVPPKGITITAPEVPLYPNRSSAAAITPAPSEKFADVCTIPRLNDSEQHSYRRRASSVSIEAIRMLVCRQRISLAL